MQETVGAIRQLRADYAVPQGSRTDVVVVPSSRTAAAAQTLFSEEAALIGRITRSNVRVAERAPREVAGHVVALDAPDYIAFTYGYKSGTPIPAGASPAGQNTGGEA